MIESSYQARTRTPSGQRTARSSASRRDGHSCLRGRRAHPPCEGGRGPLGRPGEGRARTFSRGIWAPAATIERLRAELDAERSTDAYAKRQEAASRRREEAQAEYVEDFHGAVVAFLAFHLSRDPNRYEVREPELLRGLRPS